MFFIFALNVFLTFLYLNVKKMYLVCMRVKGSGANLIQHGAIIDVILDKTMDTNENENVLQNTSF